MNLRVAVAVEADAGINSPVAFRFGRAPLFAIVEIEKGKIKNLSIIPNPNAMGHGGVGPATAQWLSSMGINVVIAPRVGPNASAALSAFGIQVRIVPPGTPLIEALRISGFINE